MEATEGVLMGRVVVHGGGEVECKKCWRQEGAARAAGSRAWHFRRLRETGTGRGGDLLFAFIMKSRDNDGTSHRPGCKYLATIVLQFREEL